MLARITLTACALVLVGCASRTTFARHPAASPTFDRASSDPKAVEIADRVIAAAGGKDKWNAVKQIRWTQSVTTGEAGKPPIVFEEAWDRWNGRHYNRLRGEGGDIVVMRPLYESGGTVYRQSGSARQSVGRADTDGSMNNARLRFEFDTTLLLMAFLLEEPGVKLALAGEVTTEADQPPRDDIKVTFDPKDPTRTATAHVIVDRATNQIERIEIVKAGDPDTKRIGYKVGTWVPVGALKLPTEFHNLGFAGEVITFSNLAADPEPDEALYVPTVTP